MKTSIHIITALLIFSFGFAQEKGSRAEKKYHNYHYIQAAAEYERLAKKGDDSQETLQRLGDIYYYNSDMANAVKWYGQLFSKYEETLAAKYIFRYIHTLKGVGNYPLAKALMKIYAEKFNGGDFEVSQFRDNDLALDELRNRQPQFVVTHLSLNSTLADFGPMYYQDKIVFASSRDTMKLHTRVYEWNQQPYLNLYEADTVELGTDLVDIRAFGNGINTKYHEAGATFNPEGTILYFTRNNYNTNHLERDSTGTNHLKIYRSQLEGGYWTFPDEVPFNNRDYSTGQPALGPDGKKLFFVSDMPGGFGGTDIYYVSIDPTGNYSEPVNLGPTINTSGKEMFPFVTDEKLYFASDGHLGLGALDIFESELGGGFSPPLNLGPEINSPKDDFAYIVDEATNRGYFSSNRAGGTGDDDIYSFKRLQPKCEQFVQGTVLRKANDQAVVNATVELKTIDGSLIAAGNTDAYGAFTFENILDCEESYSIEVSKEGYDGVSKGFRTGKILGETNNVPLVMTKELNKLIVMENGVLKIKIDDIYFDLNKADIRADAAQELDKIVEVMKEYPKMVIKIESHTDSRGSDRYNEKLSDRRAKSTGNYIVSQGIEANRIESAIGYGEKNLLNHCSNGVKCSNAEHDINRRSEFIIVSLD
ncbi:MAG: OmpA family protein [Bacteroidota bacterium]